MPDTQTKTVELDDRLTANRRVLEAYRDRIIHAIGEVRGIGCVADECKPLFDAYLGLVVVDAEVHQAVDGLLGLLWTVQHVLDKSAAAQHG